MALIKKILIANRGEIALRIIKSCKKLGIETVAVYSDADQDLPFVQSADEAVNIGESQAQKSYLHMEKILQVAKIKNADAIHPGYGFLSENPNFPKKCEKEGLIFIGPDEKIIQAMGSKIHARNKMKEAGVPVLPGCEGIEDLDEAVKMAEELGYPLMLKASAGGGGMGMKVLQNKEDLEKAFNSTVQQAKNFFGDGSIYLEKLIENPHHIEVQLLSDHHGNTVHLYDRECSVQRRNQKVIEEGPSPFLSEAKRQEICETAVKGAVSIGYKNAGTMEFLVDENQNYYFLEMNTRLQVEHPVTEEVTGLDLVELQIKVAAGEKLPFTQEEVERKGHAVECRLYAEDPKTFFPSPGPLNTFKFPEDNTRLDFGYEEGDKVSPFYDPMLGKIITSGKDREEAIRNMEKALDGVTVEGITTNLPLLQQVMKDDEFVSGMYTTKLLQNMNDRREKVES
ncbi:acetyl-CoA carboxylase biotin carboxylase subunit [Evansella sp. LMS18]|uniref:acetyl-CoA carboxylase biotin carboxylase subunit n=1 Tax=Evansella sp. LMS18 TaxID=2924033 RepID=UPI0020D1DC52|nr:acetyl-CoA carboxylase biotin carboxylase subunit [Evansella sp. LMS18]UTR09939.1 acetyl-CoA carboxylase biotin carboxylase subunit [Evansella sp. LMS18]